MLRLKDIFEELKEAAADAGTTRRDAELLTLAEIASALTRTRGAQDGR
jgi:hypothetical protein